MAFFKESKFLLAELQDFESIELGGKFQLMGNGPDGKPKRPLAPGTTNQPANNQPNNNQPANTAGGTGTGTGNGASNNASYLPQGGDIPKPPQPPAELPKGVPTDISTLNKWFQSQSGITDARKSELENAVNKYNADAKIYEAELNKYNTYWQNQKDLGVAQKNYEGQKLASDAQMKMAEAQVTAAQFQKYTADKQKEAQEYAANVQLGGQVFQTEAAYSLADLNAKISSEYRVFDQINADAADHTKDKLVPLLEKRIIENLQASQLMPKHEVTAQYYENGKRVQKTETVDAYSAIKISGLGFNRETANAGKYSEFQYYYIPEGAVKADNKTAGSDLMNIDINSPLVSSVSRIANKEGGYDFIDNKTHKAITGDEKKRIFSGVALSNLNPKLQNGQNLTGYFIPAEEGDDLYANKSLGDGSQSVYSALGKKFPNDKFRREASEILEGFLGGQMSLLQLVGKIFLLIKAGKDFGVGGKNGKTGSLEGNKEVEGDPIAALNTLTPEDKQKASELLGTAGSLKGLSEKDFVTQLDQLKRSLKEKKVADKDIDLITGSAVEEYRKQDKENKLKDAKDEAMKSTFLTTLKNLVTNTDSEKPVKETIQGKKVNVVDLLTAAEDLNVKSLFEELKKQGITTIGNLTGVENIDISKISNVKATALPAGKYNIEFLDASKKQVASFVLN